MTERQPNFEQKGKVDKRINESPESRQEEIPEKIVPKEVISVSVRGHEYLSDVLSRFRGFVAYDSKRHDITGIEVESISPESGVPGGLIGHAYTIVRE